MDESRESICGVNSMRSVAVVTGAGSGIGEGRDTSAPGFQDLVALAGRHEDALRRTLEDARAAPGDAVVVPTDVTDPDAVRGLFARVASTWGRVDLLFNNAGTFGEPASLDEVTDSDWRRSSTSTSSGSVLLHPRGVRD